MRCELMLWSLGLGLALAACNASDGSDSPGFSGGTTFSTGASSSDSGTSAASEATGGDTSESAAGDGDGDDPTESTAGDGDGDGDPTTTTGDGDGDPTTTTGDGDGDGDPTTTTGDGDTGTTGGDGDYFQGFEEGAPGPEYTTGGNGSWSIDTSSSMTGTSAGASPASTAHSSSYWAQLDLTFDVAGTFAFAYRLSSEDGYDDLIFSIDGVTQNTWTGEVPWTLSTSYPISAGQHSFRFTYDKDITLSDGSDRAWVDDITAVNGYVP